MGGRSNFFDPDEKVNVKEGTEWKEDIPWRVIHVTNISEKKDYANLFQTNEVIFQTLTRK